MITEDYVSFKTAKLLKEKGFNEETIKCFSREGELLDVFTDTFGKVEPANWNGMSEKDYGNIGLLGWYGSIACPTLQMVMKWLRDKHDIFIEISVDEMLKDNGYQWALYYNSTKEIMPYADWGKSYEEACEAAIKYCLKNLI